MSLRLGLVANYNRGPAAILASGWAEWGSRRGYPWLWFSPKQQETYQDVWDPFVYSGNFRTWATDRDCLVWFDTPPLEHITWAKNFGKRLIVLPDWRSLQTGNKLSLAQADNVLFPSYDLAVEWSQRWELSNVGYCPADPGWSVICRREPTRTPKMVISLEDISSDIAVDNLINAIAEWLRQLPTLHIIIVARRNLLKPETWRHLRGFVQRTGPQLWLTTPPLWRQRPAFYLDASLVVLWASHGRSGHAAVEATCCGAPFVGWATQPLTGLFPHYPGLHPLTRQTLPLVSHVSRLLTSPGELIELQNLAAGCCEKIRADRSQALLTACRD